MRLKLVPYVLAAAGLLIVGYGLMHRAADPPRVLSTGTLVFTDKAGTVLIFPKRVVAVAGMETSEVQLPGGTWIDCRSDCVETIKSEHTEFWDSLRMRGR